MISKFSLPSGHWHGRGSYLEKGESLTTGKSRLLARDLFWHYPHYWNGNAVMPYSMVRSGDWKLIRFYEYDREELYNLKDDPSEECDLGASQSEQRRKLSKRLDGWLTAVGAQKPVVR